MTVTINEDVPGDITFSFRIGSIKFLTIKRGSRKNAKKDRVASVYSDSDHSIVADTLRKYDKPHTHSQQLVPQLDF